VLQHLYECYNTYRDSKKNNSEILLRQTLFHLAIEPRAGSVRASSGDGLFRARDPRTQKFSNYTMADGLTATSIARSLPRARFEKHVDAVLNAAESVARENGDCREDLQAKTDCGIVSAKFFARPQIICEAWCWSTWQVREEGLHGKL